MPCARWRGNNEQGGPNYRAIAAFLVHENRNRGHSIIVYVACLYEASSLYKSSPLYQSTERHRRRRLAQSSIERRRLRYRDWRRGANDREIKQRTRPINGRWLELC